MAKTKKIKQEVSPVEKIDDYRLRYTSTRTIEFEEVVEVSLTTLKGKKVLIEKAIQDTNIGKAQAIVEADKTISMLAEQVSQIDEKIAEAADLGIVDNPIPA